MPGERPQPRSRAHPAGGVPLTGATKSTPPVLSPRPRSAPLAEDQHVQDRKRRWRPDLAVSTSAELYPTSATYTNSQGRRAGAVRPRQKASGDNHLQKTAVLNSTMAHNMATVRAEPTPLESSAVGPGLENSYRTPYAMRSDGNQPNYSPIMPDGTAHKLASAPPPHRLDYDALDHENGPWVPDNDDATEAEMVYSDFSTIDPNKPIPDDNDFFDPFQGTDLPLHHSDETAQKFIWEKEGYGGGSGGSGARGGGRGGGGGGRGGVSRGGGGGSTLHYMS